jgi:ATP-binding cassette subfamily B protein
MKWYKQADAMDCGPTCLRMVVKHYRKEISVQALRDKMQIGRGGVNLLGISDAAESIGFRTKAVKINYKVLTKDVNLPAILHWKQNHFVVLYKVSSKKLHVADPAKGLIAYSPDEFKENWTSDKNNGIGQGVALLLEPVAAFFDKEFESVKENKGLNFSNIFSYVKPYKKLILQLFTGLLVSSLLQLVLPFLTQSIVDSGIKTANLNFVFIVLLAQIALFSGRMVVELIRSWVLLHISARINLSILTDFLIKLMKLPIPFFESKHTGDIIQRINDHSRIESFLTGSSLTILFALFNLFVFSAVLFSYNTYIFFILMGSALLYSIWVILFLKKKKQLDYKRFELSAREQSVTIQMIQGMQEIKLNGVEKAIRWKWEDIQARLFKLSIKSLSFNQWQQFGASFINEGKNIFITFVSAKSVIEGQMTLGSMLAIQYMIGQVNSPIEQMISFLQSWQNAKISMDRLNEIHKLEEEESQEKDLITELPLSFAMKIAGGTNQQQIEQELIAGDPENISHVSSSFINSPNAINFKNISFTYPGAGNEPVLKNITATFPRGKTTAIVGTSGSGKTTLLKLLLKFYDPQTGEIKIDGVPLKYISAKLWRQNCGVVMQESFVFSDTLARNIAVGNDPINVNRLYHAVEMANILPFVESLPLGLNTHIGADGTGISMGQKQRILIARAIYRDPQVIFFDEATNSLDANNEHIIIKNLNSFFEGKTVIIVAHRLSTVKDADQIIVLRDGSISERGTHRELVDLKGEYYTLVKNQLELGT